MTLDNFLINPTEEALESLTNKKQAIRILRKINSSKALYFFYKRGESIEIDNCVRLMINEENHNDLYDLITSIISDMKAIKDIDDEKIQFEVKVDRIYLKAIVKDIARSGNTDTLTLILDSALCDLDLNQLAITAADCDSFDVVKLLIERGATNREELVKIVECNRKVYNTNADTKGCEELAVTVAKSGNTNVLNYMIMSNTPNHEIVREICKKNRKYLDQIKELS